MASVTCHNRYPNQLWARPAWPAKHDDDWHQCCVGGWGSDEKECVHGAMAWFTLSLLMLLKRCRWFLSRPY